MREQAALLALVAATDLEWHKTASLIEEVGSSIRVLSGEWSGFEPLEASVLERLAARVNEAEVDRHEGMITDLDRAGVRLITVLDRDYPMNLRQVFNRPPFLFVKGEISKDDERAVAVVGTRRPSAQGLEQANRLAHELALQGVTVLSGLAAGIDTAAHQGALAAGGRTVAVMGTGILRIYPRANATLASRICRQGALVSQFWPDAPPTKRTFPMRNVVMSGMAVGTVVIEASATSGAKMQARLALDHGKKVFLIESLVMQQPWAKKYAEHPNAIVVDSVDDILRVVATNMKPVKQLRLA
ncbi:MAG: DNA-processing protein DprA [Actinomycetota bacterium]